MVVNRRLLVLGATLIVAIIGVMVVRSGNEPAPVATRPRAAATDRNAASSDTPPPADVNLQALDRERGEPVESGRNPFRFRPKPAPPPPPVPVGPPRTPNTFGDAGGTFSSAPTGPPPPPPITLKFIGIVQTADGTRIAVLTDGKRPLSGREGQEIEGRYRILKIGNDSIELSYLDGRGRQTIPLKGQ